MNDTGSRVGRSRVCVVSTTPLIVHFFLRRHLQELARIADVTLVLNPSNDAYAPSLDLPVAVVPIGIKRPVSPWHDLRALWKLIRFFRKERFDLVLAVAPKAGLLGLLAARIAGVRSRVFVFQGEVWAARRGIWRWILKEADRVTARVATNLLAVSASEVRFLEREGVVRAGHVTVLGAGSICGVDLERYRPDGAVRRSVRERLGIPDDATVMLFVGRLNANKGVFELAQVFARVSESRSNFWLVIVGPDEEQVSSSIVELLGNGVGRSRLVGFSETPEVYMAAADFLCLPSHREGFGMVIVEAAAVGIPTVAFNVPGVADAVRDEETGILVEFGDVDALSDAITRYVDDPELRRRHGDAGRVRVQAFFEQNEVVGRYVSFVQNCMVQDQSPD